MTWGAETWRVFEPGGERSWDAVFPPDVDLNTLKEWQRRVLRAGEDTQVFRVVHVDLLGYARSRDGDIGDYLDQHPDRPTMHEGATIPGLVFDEAGDPAASTLLTTLDPSGRERTDEVADLYPFAQRFGLDSETYQRPVGILGIAGSSRPDEWIPFTLSIELSCSIWFPWEYQEPGLYSAGRLIDNRILARLNAPRLNAFLAAARAATESLGGTWRFGGGTTFERCELSADGVDLDAAPFVDGNESP